MFGSKWCLWRHDAFRRHKFTALSYSPRCKQPLESSREILIKWRLDIRNDESNAVEWRQSQWLIIHSLSLSCHGRTRIYYCWKLLYSQAMLACLLQNPRGELWKFLSFESFVVCIFQSSSLALPSINRLGRYARGNFTIFARSWNFPRNPYIFYNVELFFVPVILEIRNSQLKRFVVTIRTEKFIFLLWLTEQRL